MVLRIDLKLQGSLLIEEIRSLLPLRQSLDQLVERKEEKEGDEEMGNMKDEKSEGR